MLTYHKAILDSPAYYEDKASKVRYRRLLGGIGWPQPDDKGVALVLAEKFDMPTYVLLAAVMDYSGLELLTKAKTLEIQYPVSAWHGNPKNQSMLQLLHEFNREKYQEDKIKFQGAPLATEPNNSGYYLPMLVNLAQVGNKRISLGVSPEISNTVKNISPETHYNKDIGMFPMLAALCYPLSWMLTYKPQTTSITPRPVDLRRYNGAGWQL